MCIPCVKTSLGTKIVDLVTLTFKCDVLKNRQTLCFAGDTKTITLAIASDKLFFGRGRALVFHIRIPRDKTFHVVPYFVT